MTDPEDRRLLGVGFWFDPIRPSDLPRPQALVGDGGDTDARAAVIQYLRHGRVYETYRDHSWCRFDCGIEDAAMGHRELTDGTWVWPEGLAHYVEAHGVELPKELVAHALRGADPDEGAGVPFSLEWWTAWGRERGAQIDLSHPWVVVLDWQQGKRLVDQLERELPTGHELAGRCLCAVAERPDRGEVLFHLDGDRLAVVRLTGATTPAEDPTLPDTRLLDGWEAWNDDRARYP